MLELEPGFSSTADFARKEGEKIYLSLSNRELLRLLNTANNHGTAGYGGNIGEELCEYFGIPDLKLQGIYRTWNELSLQCSLGLESMHSEAYLATRYFDFRVAEIGLRAAARGCTMKIIHSRRSGLSTKLQILGNLMTHPKALGIFRKIPSSANVSIGEADLPFSFAVIDSQNVGIEIVDEEKPELFYLGVQFESHTLATKMITYFTELSKIAANHEVDGLVELKNDSDQEDGQHQQSKLGFGSQLR
jgi:hypothetical protein